MWITIKEELIVAKEQLESLKVASDTALEVKNTMGDIKDEYLFVKNFNLENELRSIVGDLGDLTYIDEFKDAKTNLRKFDLIRAEIGMRYKAEGRSQEEIDRANKRLDALQALEAIRNSYMDEAISPQSVTVKDMESRRTTAMLLMGSEAAEAKIKRMEDQIREKEKLAGELKWDADFLYYMKTDANMESGFFAGLLGMVFRTEDIYGALVEVSAVATLSLYIMVIFFAVRIMQESIDALSMKGGVLSVLTDMSKTTFLYILYSSLGLMIFGLIFLFNEIFSNFGNLNLIQDNLLSLREEMISSDKEYKDWIDQLRSYTAEVGGIITAPISWLGYKLMSLLYVFINEVSDFVFVIILGLVYILGFVLIPTSGMKNSLNLTKGWVGSFVFLALWAIIEPILLGFVYAVMNGSRDLLLEAYSGGVGTNSVTAWCLYTSLVLFSASLVKIISPFLAAYIAANQNVGAVAGGAIAGPSMLLMNNMLNRFTKEDSTARKIFDKMTPNDEGNRWRDKGSQVASDVMNTNMKDAGRYVKEGLGKMTDKFKGSGKNNE